MILTIPEKKVEIETLSEPHLLSKSQLIDLITATGSEQEALHRRAREVRTQYQEDQVWLRGVIEISSWCRKNCGYCAMRIQNHDLDDSRYRLTAEEILKRVDAIKATGIIPIAFLQSGQDPHCDPILEQVIPIIKHDYKLNVLLCLGERKKEVYQRWADLGADSYILKFETSSPTIYKNVIGGQIKHRVKCLHYIKEAGMLFGTGNIVGLREQTVEDLADDLLFALKLQPNFCSSSPFTPNDAIPLRDVPNGSVDITLNLMALYRIGLKKCLIPSVSALEKLQTGGQLRGLNAGANVLTINFSHLKQDEEEDNLKHVNHQHEFNKEVFPIYGKTRFVVTYQHALETIEKAGLTLCQAHSWRPNN